MAELNSGGGEKGGKVRSKKSNPGVDLTAMVDLAFLLITFFILTTTLSKPQSMDLALPDKDIKDPAPPPETPAWRTMTVVLGSDNKILYYIGKSSAPEEGTPKLIAYGGKGIRQVIVNKQKDVESRVAGLPNGDPKKDGLTVLIKASKASNYKNLVDILDEMAITKTKVYAIVDMTDDDKRLLKDKGLK
jgi:biopolymer transport protein ExbD